MKEFFDEYVRSFDMNLDGIDLKYKHSYRVVDYAKIIAKSLNLSSEDLKEVEDAALLHDIGRFSQYAEFHHFRDIDSIDHGDRGYDILKEKGITNKNILSAVKYHNKIDIPEALTDKEKLICMIVKDADKIDILDKITNKCTTKGYRPSNEVLKVFRENKLFERSFKIDIEGNIMSLFRQIAFIFDVNFKKSLEIFKEKDFINKKIDLILEDNNYPEVEEIRNICNNYLERRLEDEGTR